MSGDGSAHGSSETRRGAEGELLLRHREGDPTAFRDLVMVYRAPVYSYLARSGVDGVERDDLFQEIFVRVHRAAASYRPDRPLHPWLFTIVANAVRNHRRTARVRELVFGGGEKSGEPSDPRPDGERRVRARETVAWLEAEIPKLPAPQREVLLLVSVENLPLKEVAQILGLPLNTVKTRLRRARLALTRALVRRNGGCPEEIGEVMT